MNDKLVNVTTNDAHKMMRAVIKSYNECMDQTGLCPFCGYTNPITPDDPAFHGKDCPVITCVDELRASWDHKGGLVTIPAKLRRWRYELDLGIEFTEEDVVRFINNGDPFESEESLQEAVEQYVSFHLEDKRDDLEDYGELEETTDQPDAS